MFDLTEIVARACVAQCLFPAFPVWRVKLDKKMLHLNCFFRVELMTKVFPKLFKYEPSHLKINSSIHQKFIFLKQDCLKGKEAVVYFVIFTGE